MKDFIEVFENDDDLFPAYLVCAHCGDRVERGIVSVSEHYLNCLERREGLIEVRSKEAQEIIERFTANVKRHGDLFNKPEDDNE